MLGYYNYSVILTYVSLVFAMFGISFGRTVEGLFPALLCLIISGVCDMFDGAIARTCKRNEEEKLFGIQIDSLCDLVAFGVLPAFLTVQMADGSVFSKIAATLLVLSSVIRLGFFNVQETMRDREEPRKYYTGMPVTMAALTYPALLLLGTLLSASASWWMPLCVILLAGLEVSRIPLKKPYGMGKVVMLAVGAVIFILLFVFRSQLGQ